MNDKGQHSCDDMPPRFGWGVLCIFIAVIAFLWSVLLLTAPPSDAAGSPAELESVSSQEIGRWVQPYGGCKEAWQAPQSTGAKECRVHGWTVRPRLVVGPHGVVRYTSMPHCWEEDNSAGPVPCTWNLGTGHDGNGYGAGFWVHRGQDDGDVITYVWDHTPAPIHNGTAHWATRAERAKYGISRYCMVRHTTARCPG